MKRITHLIVYMIIVLVTVSTVKAKAEEKLYATGIGLRGSFYNMSGQTSTIYVRDHCCDSDVHVGGFGGALFLNSRINRQLVFEITIGAIGRVENESVYFDEEEVDVSAVSPLLFGVRFEPTQFYQVNNVTPYVSAGLGPYWTSDIHVRETTFDEEVNIKTTVHPGGFFGGGFNFAITDGFAVNFDLKYHMIKMDPNHEFSGLEYGIGFQVSWGDFN